MAGWVLAMAAALVAAIALSVWMLIRLRESKRTVDDLQARIAWVAESAERVASIREKLLRVSIDADAAHRARARRADARAASALTVVPASAEDAEKEAAAAVAEAVAFSKDGEP